MAAFSPLRLFASSPFRRLAGRGALVRSFPFSMVLHVLLSLTRSVIVCGAAYCSVEVLFFECGRPCDALSCLFFSDLRLQQSQSLLVQEIQSSKDIDLTCFKTFPINVATCIQVGSMFPEVPNDDQQRGALPALETECSSSTTPSTTAYCWLGWIWPFPCRRSAVCCLEHQRSHWICFL